MTKPPPIVNVGKLAAMFGDEGDGVSVSYTRNHCSAITGWIALFDNGDTTWSVTYDEGCGDPGCCDNYESKNGFASRKAAVDYAVQWLVENADLEELGVV